MTKQVSYKTMIILLIVGVLLFSSSVLSQPLTSQTIISDNLNLVSYLIPGVVVFLWGANSRFLS
ncbi:MAG: hypothetical protein WC979_08045 [Candidatus Pacearchaeota archaeon]